MERVGIISGMYFLKEGCFPDFEERTMENCYGRAEIYLNDEVAFLARHGNPARRHILPHLINHQANMAALKDLDVREIFSLNSTGSLKKQFRPGMFAVPADFIMLERSPAAMISGGREDHMVPELSAKVRQAILAAVRSSGVKDVIEDCVYWQTSGPRLETKAEIRMMARFADLVGMTMASEAVVALEMGMAYASLCSIDNFAHGVIDEDLTMEGIIRSAREHQEAITLILDRFLELRRGAKAGEGQRHRGTKKNESL
ncbi:MAG: MTAP family purine nucleoside phosphorylase [Smithellaceae bacterium]|nr:MTAP family purine nucleoside phosphorylase [Smithellaceae bacterium]